MGKLMILAIVIIVYLLIGTIFGIASIQERKDYSTSTEKVSDFLISLLLWPILLISRIICHGGDFLKIFQGCKMLPPGLS